MPDEEKPAYRKARTAKSKNAIRCHAHKMNGDPCKSWATEGQLVCKRHGGMAPQAITAAKVRLNRQHAVYELARLGIKGAPVENALEELARAAGDCVAWKDAAGRRLAELAEADWRYQATHGEMLRSEVAVWERALDRCVVALSAMARLNLDERLVVIEEGKARLVAQAFADSLNELPGLDPDHVDIVRRSFARRLRALPGKAS